MTEPAAPKKITVLGATGSIGKSALDVVRKYPGRFEVIGLGAHSNVALLAEQVREFQPRFVAVSDPEAAKHYAALGLAPTLLCGMDGMNALASEPVDVVLCALVGAVGIHPLIAAIRAGNNVAVANKEPFVMAGEVVMAEARARGVSILPVDSEHNAVFQCLQGVAKEDVACIHLTASGGPFYRRDRESLREIRPEEAMRHPTWEMGAKISVDSATLMNKGLEIIEAMWLFGLPESQIQVVIHPQSIVHSLVEFKDGNILAQLGITDMRFPILFALSYPDRVQCPMDRLDLTRMQALTFDRPDFSAFPCLRLAREAAARGGTAPAILNAANEEAVAAFCGRRLPFLGISEVVEAVCAQCPPVFHVDLETVLDADRQARETARRVMENNGSLMSWKS
ncbi:MAG: 1-deoxy-D-xylulose-5-phosphate reductoisomerase [Candidatus Hydrogenedentes bacterium]|nr:1-deoxy-D-xylulose-5-phosphate reductoisomerase [Candidatus Hydrogenedentota bacterium]